MMFSVSIAQPVGGDMCVNLRGGYIGMTKHRLDGTQVGPARQQMAGE